MTQWQPTSSLNAWQARANLYRTIRQFFDERHVLEVDTPQLARFGVTDINIDCIAVPGYGYLQSSPEYHMKRMLAAGAGAIWQLVKSFRDGEAGKRHNPEFTLLEWYRPGFILPALIDEVIALLHTVLPERPPKQMRFRDAFQHATQCDPMTASDTELRRVAERDGNQLPADLTRAQLVDWLMATAVETQFDPQQLTVITEFPGWAAALAQTKTDSDGQQVAQRFEVYSGGVELANGYLELLDAQEQAARFEHDRQLRQQLARRDREPDTWLLQALAAGIAPVSGVAMGIERLLMVMLDTDDIADVLTFPVSRA